MTAENVRIKPTKYRDLDAAACDRRFLRGRLLLGAVCIALVLLNLAVSLTFEEAVSFWQYLLIMLLIVAAFWILLIRWAAGLYQILYTDCDPVKFLQILELQKKRLRRKRYKSNHRLIRAMALSYLEDWDAVYQELGQFQARQVKNRSLKYLHLNLLGDYSLVKDQREAFEACRQQLLKLTGNGKARDKKLVDQILLVWDRRIACVTQDREREREVLLKLLGRQKKYLIQEVIWGFRLAQLDLLEGKEKDAEARLRFAAEYGNTLPVRAWAKELLERQLQPLPEPWADREEKQERTGERNHGNDTE